MYKTIESVISMIVFIILTTKWIHTSSNIVIMVKKNFKTNHRIQDRLHIMIIYGLILEILLSIFYIILSVILSNIKLNDSLIILGMKNGVYYTALLSPISSMTGAARGLSRRILK